jgi:hypothetical protein
MALVLLCCVSFMLNIAYAECLKQALYAECCYADCRYAECCGASAWFAWKC